MHRWVYCNTTFGLNVWLFLHQLVDVNYICKRVIGKIGKLRNSFTRNVGIIGQKIIK